MRRSARGSWPTFFEPSQFGGQATNFGIERVELDRMGSLLIGERAPRLVIEQAGQAGQGLVAPEVELVGMEAVLGGDLADRAGFAQDFADDFSFEAGAVGLAGLGQRIPPL